MSASTRGSRVGVDARARRVPLVALLSLAGWAWPAAAQDYTHPRQMDLPEPAFQRPDPGSLRLSLENGLTAYVAEDDRAPLVTLTTFVAGGSADGAPGEAAVVAAALRRGPASMGPGEFRRALDEMAAAYAVTVTLEEMEITLDVPAEDAWRALELFAGLVREPAFGADGAGGPGRASQAEGIDWASSIAGAIAAFNSSLYRDHVFGRTPTAGDMDAARAGGAQRFHSAYFVPSNVTLAVSGDFDDAEARRRTEAAFAGWAAADRPDLATFAAVETSAPRQVLQAQADKLQGWVVIGHELPQVPADEQAAVDVMNYILGAVHLDARLFREARELRGLTNDNSAFPQPALRGPGTYTFQTYGRPEAVRLLVDVTFRELEKIRDSQVTQEEIFVAKGALVDGTHAARYATGHDATRTYALEWLRHGDHERSERYPDRVGDVTIGQVQEAARKYIHPDRMLVAVVGPLEQIEGAPMIENEPQLDAWGDVVRVDGGGR